MTDTAQIMAEVDGFVNEWQTGAPMRDCFVKLADCIRQFEDVELNFISRPGISFSLRPKHVKQQGRELFGMVDVIDDDPEERWLSVCFYEDLIADPEERGDIIPDGLAGGDGYCFDMYEADDKMTDYLVARLQEAYKKASL